MKQVIHIGSDGGLMIEGVENNLAFGQWMEERQEHLAMLRGMQVLSEAHANLAHILLLELMTSVDRLAVTDSLTPLALMEVSGPMGRAKQYIKTSLEKDSEGHPNRSETYPVQHLWGLDIWGTRHTGNECPECGEIHPEAGDDRHKGEGEE